MATYEPPADLVELKRALIAAEDRRRQIGQAMPLPTAVAAGEAEISDEQRAEWDWACAESARLAEEIHQHPWWDTVDHRPDADAQLFRLATA